MTHNNLCPNWSFFRNLACPLRKTWGLIRLFLGSFWAHGLSSLHGISRIQSSALQLRSHMVGLHPNFKTDIMYDRQQATRWHFGNDIRVSSELNLQRPKLLRGWINALRNNPNRETKTRRKDQTKEGKKSKTRIIKVSQGRKPWHHSIRVNVGTWGIHIYRT